nr:MAG TPA: hypothetical protein [Caudoviricetes sp.]
MFYNNLPGACLFCTVNTLSYHIFNEKIPRFFLTNYTNNYHIFVCAFD